MTNKYMYFIANWKMYGDLKSIKSLNKVIKFTRQYKKKKFKIIYCPPYTLLDSFYKKIKKTKIELGAQNCHFEISNGPFTGSISPTMLKKIGSNYVIIGHSENRSTGETNVEVNKKIKSSIKSNLKVIFCIGETLMQKKRKLTNKILHQQIIKGLFKIKNLNKILIAYEPVWSIGTGVVPKIDDLDKNITFIKNVLKKHLKEKNPKVLYGGSVNSKNVENLVTIKAIDGFLVGGASQKAKNFIDIVKKTII
jgi:triosephosphate isomerase